MKVKIKDLSKEDRIRTLDALYTAASHARGRTEMKAFLRDLLTESERVMLGRRILIARDLLARKSFEDIGAEMHVSSRTIAKVQRWLLDQFPGYEKALAGMEKEFAGRIRRTQQSANVSKINRRLYATSAIYRLKKKYPIHFLLFPWPKEK